MLRVLVPILLLLLSACDMPGQVTARHISQDEVSVVANGNPVRISVPVGFCVAEDSVTTSEQGAFILISGCLQGDQDDATRGALLTASVSFAPLFPQGQDRAIEIFKLEEFLRGDAGLPLLGRGGDAAALSVLESRSEDDTLYLLVEDKGAQIIPNAEERFWRAFLEVNERMVSLSISTFQDDPANDRVMLRQMEAFVAAIRKSNATLKLDDLPILNDLVPEKPTPATDDTPATASDTVEDPVDDVSDPAAVTAEPSDDPTTESPESKTTDTASETAPETATSDDPDAETAAETTPASVYAPGQTRPATPRPLDGTEPTAEPETLDPIRPRPRPVSTAPKADTVSENQDTPESDDTPRTDAVTKVDQAVPAEGTAEESESESEEDAVDDPIRRLLAPFFSTLR